MITEENKELVSIIAEDIWNKGKMETANKVMADNAKYYGPHMPNGVGSKKNWINAITMYRNAFPDSYVTYEELITFSDFVVGRWIATVTHTGKLQGIEKVTGKQIAISGITIYRISNGKIIEACEQLDLLGIWQQLGFISLPRSELKGGKK